MIPRATSLITQRIILTHSLPPRSINFQATRQSGHSHWSTIRHKKAENDLRRGNQIAKVMRQIIAAVGAGNGETDPSFNMYLAAALSKAKDIKMPKTNLQSAMAKATNSSGGSGERDEEVMLELMGPANVPCLVECLTSNPLRVRQHIQAIIKKRGGAFSNVGYLFQKRGFIKFASSNVDLDKMVDDAIDIGVEDVVEELDAKENKDGSHTVAVLVDFQQLATTKKELEKRGYEVRELERIYTSDTETLISGEDQRNFSIFLDQCDESEDIVKVHHTAIFEDDE